MKIVVVGAGPAGALAALYAAKRDYEVEVYELRDGRFLEEVHASHSSCFLLVNWTKSV